ncbi:MAG TPA: hypothetical protein VFQ05_10965 [Candidatus Eisenbacteria bacterium]|nr:hypothetical protein [Candidatus Eisenbacteria bacterium]
MKRIIGMLVLMAALSSVALAVTGDTAARQKDCPASGICPMPCGGR